MLTISGKPTSANVQKTLWTIEEIGAPYEHLPEHAPQDDPTDAVYADYRGRPAPILADDDFTLWEANAICRYLAVRLGAENLFPADLQIRAGIERWMDYQQSTVRVHIHALLRDDLSDEEIGHHSHGLDRCMEPLETKLARCSYLAGDEFTLADIPLGIVTFRWMLLDVTRAPVPAIEDWLKRISERPAFQKTVCPPVNTKVGLIA